MPVKHPAINFIHLCDAASVDSLNKVSVLGIFSNIYFPSVPNTFLKMTLVANIAIGDLPKEEHTLSIKLYNPKGEEIVMKLPINIKFKVPDEIDQKRKSELNMIIEITMIEFKEFGEHKYDLLIDNEILGSKKFLVEEKVA